MIEQNINEDYPSNYNDSVLVPSLYPSNYNQLQAQVFRNSNNRHLISPIMEQPVDDLSMTPIIDNVDLIIPPQALVNDDKKEKNDIEKEKELTVAKKLTNKPKHKQSKSRPAFIMKLWTMVNDESNKELINWVDNGKSFLVTDREKFVQQVLPKYFKHSNFSSFVRQLNMYGWRKVQDANSGSLHNDEKWQFINPNFQQGKPELLDKIARNKSNEEHEDLPNSLDVSLLIKELNTLKANQLKITQELSRVRSDNELLWQELFKTREKNLLQNDKIEKILQFLASVYGNNAKQLAENFQGQHTLQNSSYNNYSNNSNQNNGYVQPQQPLQQPMQPPPQPLHHNHNHHHHNQHSQQRSSIDSDEYGNINPSPMRFKPRLMLKQQRHVSNPSETSSLVDDSPIQEIVRTPTEYPMYPPNYDQSYGSFTQSSNSQPSPLPFAPTLINQQSLQQSQQPQQPFSPPTTFVQSPLLQPTPPTNGSSPLGQGVQPGIPQQPYVQPIPQEAPNPSYKPTESELKPRLNHAQSYKDLSKSVEQQGHDIDELITKLQNQQTQQTQQIQSPNSSSSVSTTPSTAAALDQNFDLNEFLNDDILPYDDGKIYQGIKKRGNVVNLEDEGDIEEVFNPSKKRRSDQFKK